MKLKIELPKIRVSQKKLYVLSALIIIAVFSTLGFFLYKNIYQSITQSEQIIILRQEVAPDIIDMKKFNNVLEKIIKKTSPEEINLENIKNPFLLQDYEISIKGQAEPEITIDND